jgi:hypothetical protein
MKRLLTNYEPYNEILKDNGIDEIYYKNRELLYVDCNGNNIYPYELESELLEDIQKRIDRNDGEEVE